MFGSRGGGERGLVGKAKLCIMLRMVSSSNLYSRSRRVYVLSLLYRNLMASY